MRALSALLLAAATAASRSPSFLPLNIATTPSASLHGAGVLRHVLPELHAVLAAMGAQDAPGDGAPEVEFDLSPGWRAAHRTAAAEASTREVLNTHPPRVRVTAGGLLGLAYAVHDLREHLALRVPAGAPAAALASAVLAFGAAAPPTPLYATRA